MRLAWHPLAAQDFLAIIDYIAVDNPAAATAFKQDVEARVATLTSHPDLGRPGRVASTRELVVRQTYIVVYTEQAGSILILRLLHGARQWP